MIQKGSILITSIWALSILTIFAASLSFQAGEHMLLIKKELKDFEAKTDFVSGLELADYKIASDPKPHEDSLADEWYGTLKLDRVWNDRVSISVTDEESKINLNSAAAAFLKEFLKLFEEEIRPLKIDKRDFVKAILEIRTKRRFKSIEELYLIDGIDKEDVEALRPFITVYPDEPQMNINTVKPLILSALIRTLSGDDMAKKELHEKLLKEQKRSLEKKDVGILSEGLQPGFFMSKLGLSQSSSMLQVVNEFLQNFTTDSKFFEVQMRSKAGKQACAMIRQTGMAKSLEVLSWHEE